MTTTNLIRSLLLLLLSGGLTLSAQQSLKKKVDINGLRYELSPNLSEWSKSFTLAQNSPFSRTYVLASFEAIPDLSTQKSLKDQGLTLLEYYGNQVYLASLNGQSQPEQLRQKGLRHLSPLQTQMIQSEEIWTQAWPAHIMKAANRLQLSVNTARDLGPEEFQWLLSQIPGQVLSENAWLGSITVEVDMHDLPALTALPGVIHLGPAEEAPKPEGENAGNLHRSNTLISDIPGARNYTGDSIVTAIGDNGEVLGHIDWQNRVTNITWVNPGDHAELCAGVLIGAGNLNPLHRGHAPEARVRVYKSYRVLDNMPTPYDNQGVRITSHSLGGACNGQYNSATRSTDLTTQYRPGLLNVFSAGNSGQKDCGYVQSGSTLNWGNITGGRKIAKNCITVGGVADNDFIYNSTSRGPSSDGRLKPEVVANAVSVMTTKEGNIYGGPSGTSLACPAVAGTFAQMLDAWDDIQSTEAPAALMKAILMNTAEDLGKPGPDYKFGYGRINALRAVRVIEDGRFLGDTVAQGQSRSVNLNVPANVKEVKIMLCWTDVAAPAYATDVLVNDLDLSITAGSQTFLPLVLDPSPNSASLNTAAQPDVDTLNNHEQVVIENTSPNGGTLTVTVSGTEVPLGSQQYYLTYEFLYDSIEVTYPIGGEGWVPGETKAVHWDAYGDQGTFAVQISTNNGSAWTTLAGNVDGDKRRKEVTVPSNITGDALIRVSRNGLSDESDNPFSIMPTAENLTNVWACDMTFMGSWDPVSGADGYDVYLLGTEKMKYAGSTTNNYFTFGLTNPGEEAWWSVVATTSGGAKSRRCNAKKKAAGTFNCSGQAPVAGFSVDQKEQCTGGSLTFSDESSAGVVSTWSWNFGAGASPATATGPGPHTVTYSSTGLKTISQTVSGPDGSDILSESNYLNIISGGAASVSLSVSPGAVCKGELITLNAHPTLGGTPTYNWFLNNQLYGTFGKEISSDIFEDGDKIGVQMVSNLSCVSGSPANSNIVTLQIDPWINPSVKIVPNGLVCKGVNSTLDAVALPGASTYEWFLNGVLVQSGGSSYTNVFNELDEVKVHVNFTGDCLNEEQLTSPAFIVAFDAGCSPTPKTDFVGGLSIAPNPSQSSFRLYLHDTQDPMEAGIYDAQGRLLQQISLEPGQSTEVGADLAAGLYILRTRGSLSQSYRLLKTH